MLKYRLQWSIYFHNIGVKYILVRCLFNNELMWERCLKWVNRTLPHCTKMNADDKDICTTITVNGVKERT